MAYPFKGKIGDLTDSFSKSLANSIPQAQNWKMNKISVLMKLTVDWGRPLFNKHRKSLLALE